LPKFFKNVVITSDFIFFQISGIFSDVFCCFLPANKTNEKTLSYRNFNNPFLCSIQSLETWNLRDRDDTWSLRERDRDSQKWVSRPRPSLGTPLLAFPITLLWIYGRCENNLIVHRVFIVRSWHLLCFNHDMLSAICSKLATTNMVW